MSEPSVNVALRVPRTEAEGPGLRYALWAQGCSLRCEGCCNPEFLAAREATRVPVRALLREAAEAGVEGVSLLGGEPFEQPEALAAFAEGARALGLSVMVFTGYTLDELRARAAAGERSVAALLTATDLLLDGRYERALRTTRRRWVGSENQRMHFLTERYRPDDPRFAEANTVELRLRGGVLELNGFPVRGAATALVPAAALRRSAKPE